MSTNYIVLIILFLSIIAWFYFKKNKSFPTLTASIYQDDNSKAKVIFEEKHPSINESEYVKICLHFFAKSLNICKDGDENNNIIQLLNSVKNQGLDTTKSSLINSNDLNISSCHKITATLRYVDSISRTIVCKVPMKYYAGNGLILNSVKAILIAVNEKISEENREVLIKSIGRMLEMYNSKYSMKSFKDTMDVPNHAFLESF